MARAVARRLIPGVVAAWALLGCTPSASTEAGGAPVVATDLGRVRGIAEGRGAIFRGIPYAVPPVGPLRWRPAQAAVPWSGIRDATAFGPDCIQPVRPGRDDAGEPAPQSEDCLTLNIATPDMGARRLPVLVSIHGGAFFVGSGRYIAERGLSAIVRRGVVLVSPNYRLGRFGFFAHPAISRDEPAGNYWLTDQIAALEWVKRNIARFGGDPGNVTILGCSAGGSSVNALMASPRARGLFAKASVHSGGGLFNATRPLDVAEAQGLEFAARAGVTGEGADALAKLRALAPAAILAADPGPPNYGAIVDGKLLPDQISVIFARGEMARVPLIAGSTSDEASVFGLMGFDRKVLKERFDVDVDALRPVYGPLGDAQLLRQVQTDFIFTAASMGMATLAARAELPSYAYHFDFVPAAERGARAGAPHCADMPHMFGIREAPTPEEKKIANTLQGYLVNFMRTGDPNGPGLAHWPRFQPPHAAPLVIGEQIRPVAEFRARQLAHWFAKWSAATGEKLD